MDDTTLDTNKSTYNPNYFDTKSSSEDEFDTEVVLRRPLKKSSAQLLEDGGDGSPADLLGTTPPRARIRNKEKRRNMLELESKSEGTRTMKNSTDGDFYQNIQNIEICERMKKRASLKLIRSRERDYKLSAERESRLEPPVVLSPQSNTPNLIESCSRFMSLSSRLKCRTSCNDEEEQASDCRELPRSRVDFHNTFTMLIHMGNSEKGARRTKMITDGNDEEEQASDCRELPRSRVDFHNTFTMLIHMGNSEKGARRTKMITDGNDEEEQASDCRELPRSRVDFHNTFTMLIHMMGNSEKGARRTISHEEQVWQNEVADLIWLELQARLASRSLTEQDAFLCAQRHAVTTVLNSINQYRFVYDGPCEHRQKYYTPEELERVDENGQKIGELGCLVFDCRHCYRHINKAHSEVGALLDSFYTAASLFPSRRAMTQDHLPAQSDDFNNKLKAMILWYNTTQHLKITIKSLSKLIRAVKIREERRRVMLSKSGDQTCASPQEQKPCQVRFNVESSDGSANSDVSRQQADSGNDTTDGNTDQSIPSTPEPERGPLLEPSLSHESGYHSPHSPHVTRKETFPHDKHTFPQDKHAPDDDDAAELSELTVMKILGDERDSPYELYLHDLLKTQGVRRSTLFLFKMRKHVLDKVFMTFEKPQSTSEEDEKLEKDSFDHDDQSAKDAYELKRLGWWSTERGSLALPSPRGAALLLAAAALETVHAALRLRLRLAAGPNAAEPAATAHPAQAAPPSPSIFTVKQIIHELKEGLDIAASIRGATLQYIQSALEGYSSVAAMRSHLVTALTANDATTSAVMQQYFRYLILTSREKMFNRGCWETECAFIRRLSASVHATDMADQAFTEIMVNQLDLQRQRFTASFEEISKRNDPPTEEDNEDIKRHFVFAICRETQAVYARERDSTLQAAGLARAAAATMPRRPISRDTIFSHMLQLSGTISGHICEILERSQVAQRDSALGARVRELLLQLFKLGFELHKELYRFVQSTTRVTSRDVTGGRPISLQPERAPSVERRQRPETVLLHDNMLHREVYKFTTETSTEAIKSRVPNARPKLYRGDSIVDYDNRWYGETKQLTIEQLLSGEKPSPEDTCNPQSEDDKEFRSQIEQQWASKASRCIIDYAKCWMSFVMERCDRGRGLRPRWASQGLEFLMLACDPNNTRHLSDDEFEELKSLMDACISHVVGSRAPAPALTPRARPRHRLHSPVTVGTSNCNSRSPSETHTPPTTPTEIDGVTAYTGNDYSAFSARAAAACAALEAARQAALQRSGVLGRVVQSASTPEPRVRHVAFPWQRGLKIGSGTFGKVYTVINTATGQLLAMKELSVGAERRALQRAANELTVLEGVAHPHLLRYYGAEVHMEEMLIFMELCVEGSLEALIATSGPLPEHTIRKYTKQLVSAVHELHKRKIAHRDIKSGNIFLTNEGHCLKLGDFGCAVKIRANTTAMGELQGYVGTQAYMAPEVFMKSSGHGRAADIWSLGCVITEMASGKRPFSEYDSNYSIMFVVGMGGRPQIPSTLSDEGSQFCRECLTHEPSERPRAKELAQHPFLNMLKSDEDCNCTAGYLITKTEQNIQNN